MATEVLEQATEERPIRRRASIEEFWSLPESVLPTEYIGGEIITAPTPTAPRQGSILRMASVLQQFVSQNSLGEIFISPLGHDTLTKRNPYEKDGARECWIVDVKGRVITQLALRKKHYALAESGDADAVKGAVPAGFEMKVGELIGG